MSSRELPLVIDEMLKLVPSSEVGLQLILKELRESASWSPPESIADWWRDCGRTLESALKSREHEPWVDQLLTIWNPTWTAPKSSS